MKPLIIYHGGCPDGFGAAWSFWTAFRDEAEYFPATHGNPPPDVLGRDVFIVDFSYSREIVENMIKDCSSLVILDHHKTAEKSLSNLPCFIYDVNHSGAYMAWRYLYGESSVPNIIKFIEDRDLWKMQIEESKYMLDFLDLHPYDFEIWSDISKKMEKENPDYNKILDIGRYLYKYKMSIVDRSLKTAHTITISGEEIPAVNSPFLQSEIGDRLVVGSQYSCVYTRMVDGYRFSLRSNNSCLESRDVAEVASKFGGGGHKNSAGFKIKNLELLK